jgi:hypothetical protein
MCAQLNVGEARRGMGGGGAAVNANANALAAAYMAAGYGMVAPHMMHYPPGALLLLRRGALASVPVCV